jgi:hypothetical protein
VEHGHQIQAMGSIYSSAKEVIVWLGDGNEDSQEVIDFTKTVFTSPVGSTDNDDDSTATTRFQDQNRRSINKRLIDCFHQKNNPQLHKVCQLLQRPWWQRAWIVQEFVKAKDVVLHIGHQKVHWRALHEVVSFLAAMSAFVEPESGLLPARKSIDRARSSVSSALSR